MIHARLVVSFLPVTNEGRWLLARGGQRGGGGECDALSCPLARLLLIKNHNALLLLRSRSIAPRTECMRVAQRVNQENVPCTMHNAFRAHTERTNNAFTPSSGHKQDGILPWLEVSGKQQAGNFCTFKEK